MMQGAWNTCTGVRLSNVANEVLPLGPLLTVIVK